MTIARSTQRKERSARVPKRTGGASGRKELKKSAVTRQRILDCAAAIFAREGYGRALMSEIAQAAGIHLQNLYYHFSDKGDIAEGVITYMVKETHRDIIERVRSLPSDVSYNDKFRAAIHAQLESIVARRDYVRAESKIQSELDLERQERCRAVVAEWGEFWRALLQEGLKLKVFRRGMDLGIARMILTGSVAWTVEWYRVEGRTVSEIADQIADTMMNGMGAANCPPKPASRSSRAR